MLDPTVAGLQQPAPLSMNGTPAAPVLRGMQTYPTITVSGVPITEGSLQPAQTRDHVCPVCGKAHGRVFNRHDESFDLRRWRQAIARLAAAAWTQEPLRESCFVLATFTVPKPSREHSEKDVDKLVRAVLDALKGVAFTDDKHVALALGVKHYAGANQPNVGATIDFGRMEVLPHALERFLAAHQTRYDYAGATPASALKARKPRPLNLRNARAPLLRTLH